MRKIICLIGVVGIFALTAGCEKKAKQEDMPLSPEQILEETQAPNQQMPTIPAQNTSSAPLVIRQGQNRAVTAQNVISQQSQPEVAAPLALEKPTPQAIQQALTNAGLYEGKIDGVIGPKSKKAIQAFQEQNGLNADGKVGPKTWEKLGAYLSQTPQAVVTGSSD